MGGVTDPLDIIRAAADLPDARLTLTRVQGLTEVVWQGAITWAGGPHNYKIACRRDPVVALTSAARQGVEQATAKPDDVWPTAVRHAAQTPPPDTDDLIG